MLYVDDDRAVSKSPEQKRLIATMYTAFGLTVSGTKTKTPCLLKRGKLDTIATFSV